MTDTPPASPNGDYSVYGVDAQSGEHTLISDKLTYRGATTAVHHPRKGFKSVYACLIKTAPLLVNHNPARGLDTSSEE